VGGNIGLAYVVATAVTALGGAVGAAVAVLRYRGSRAEAALVYFVVREGSPTAVEVVNGSPFAVSGLVVTAWEHGRRSHVWRFVGRDRWMTGRRIADARCPATLKPGQSFECEVPAPSSPSSSPPAGEPAPVTLRFRDGRGRGRQWVVWPAGRVTPLNPSVHWWHERRRTRWTRRLREAQDPTST
jgi:hypothetical protein